MPPLPRVATAAVSATLTGVGRTRRPRLRGRLKLAGLGEPVEVIRDRWGVPHIYAGSITDLLFAQGFVHAQDRLWQMDFQRRVVAGRLAEVLGPPTVAVDRGMRVLGMYRVAEAEVGLLSDRGRGRARGVCGRGECVHKVAAAAGRVRAAPLPARALDSRPIRSAGAR